MKQLTLLLIICLAIGCAPKQNEELNGTWIPIKQEMGGKQMPVEAMANQKLIIKDSTYTVIAESVDKGIIKYKKGKLDIYGKDGVNAGKHYTAIYKLENKQLTICYNLNGDTYPEGFDTKDKPMCFLSVFKQE